MGISKNARNFLDLCALTATMTTRMVLSVLLCIFAAFRRINFKCRTKFLIWNEVAK